MKFVDFVVGLVIGFFNLWLGWVIAKDVGRMWDIELIQSLTLAQYWGWSFIIMVMMCPTTTTHYVKKKDDPETKDAFCTTAGLVTSFALCIGWVFSLIYSTLLLPYLQ